MQRVIYKTNVVIKKWKCPCCFKGVKNLAVTEIIKKRNPAYYSKNGYEKWIINLQKRRKRWYLLTSLKLTTLHIRRSIIEHPLNPFSYCQTEGIRSSKAYYKTLALKRLVTFIDKGKDLPVFDFRLNENPWFVVV